MKFTFAPEATPLPGYTIKRAIDRGGFGEVYYALSDSGKEVALKLLQRNQQVELRGVRQCLNLKHPNLVTIFDIRTDADGDDWVVMEFVSGKSLEQVLEEHPRGLPTDEVEAWLSGMATGAAYLHDRGIVHRDLKPANVFRENGIVKIGDVGLSKFITPSRRSAQTESVGTVYYMAPEVARGKYGSELDVYSLGVILYEMLTGTVPFTGESTGEILMKHLTESPDLSKVAAPYRPVLERALDKDPQRRTPGADKLLEDFRRARRGQPINEVATEIPASHFVDVPQVERNATRKPPAPVSPVRPENHEAPTQYFAGAAPSPTPPRGPAPHPHRPVPPARELGRNARQFGQGACRVGDQMWAEIQRRPWLAGVIAFVVLSALFRGRGGSGLAVGEFWAVLGISAAAFYAVKNAVARSQSQAGVRPGPVAPPPPRPNPPYQAPPVQPVAAARAVAPPRPAPPARPGKVKPPPVASPATVRDLTWQARLGNVTAGMTCAVLWTAIVTAALSGAIRNLPRLSAEREALTSPAGLGLFGVTTLLGSWAVILSAKLFEGTGLDVRGRRLLQAALGAAVGAIAWGLHQDLLTVLPIRNTFPGFLDHVGPYALSTAESVRQPTLAGFIVYFAALFGVRQWWLLADGYRLKRVRIVSALFTGMIAFVLPAVVIFPQNWGTLWGLSMAAVVQLSTSWTAPAQRPAVPTA